MDSPSIPRPPKVVRAQRFELVDNTGRVRAALKIKDSSPRLTFLTRMACHA